MSKFLVFSGEGNEVEYRLNEFFQRPGLRIVKWEATGGNGHITIVVEYELKEPT